MTALIVAAAVVGACAALGSAMKRGDGDRSHSVRPVPPRPARPVDPAAWVDPRPVDPNAPWRDPQAVAA